MLDVISNKKAEWGKIAKQKKNNLTWNDAKKMSLKYKMKWLQASM